MDIDSIKRQQHTELPPWWDGMSRRRAEMT